MLGAGQRRLQLGQRSFLGVQHERDQRYLLGARAPSCPAAWPGLAATPTGAAAFVSINDHPAIRECFAASTEKTRVYWVMTVYLLQHYLAK